MKYLFVGLGSIGQRHLTNLRKFTQDQILAVRTNLKNREEFDKKYNLKSFTNIDDALKEKPDVTFITNPSSLHIPIAQKAAESGSHLFIEKPISHNLEGVEKLFSTLKENNKQLFVAFNYRFHPNLMKIKELLKRDSIGKVLFARIQVGQYLPDWHPDKDYSKEYSARKDLGGGVLLTLIHEIDYAYWLFGGIRSVMAETAKLSNLNIDVEDTASILLKTKNNALVEIHLDYLQRPLSRTSEIIGEKGKIVWDYSKNKVKLYLNDENQWYSFTEEEFKRNDMYKKELHHFIKCIKNDESPEITKEEVLEVMKVVEAVKKSSHEGKRILLED